jgi:hypothetical protein
MHFAVILRESGGPSLPETLRFIIGASAYWVARSSRAMTVVDMAKRCANPTHAISIQRAARLRLTSSAYCSDVIV